MKRSITIVLAIALLLAAACSTANALEIAKADVPRASAAPADAMSAAAALNAFGFELYRQLASGDANMVVSPTSIAFALAMARAGARGNTAAEMDAVLHRVASDANATWLNALDQALAERSGSFKDHVGNDQQVTLRIANAAFGQRGMALQAAYLEALASRFGSGLRLVDYVASTDAARQLINGWVSDQTERRIPELLAQGVITQDTRLALVNAIYLKAAWQTPFPLTATKPAAFTLADGSTIQVPTMATAGELRYVAGAGWRAVEIPYIGGSLAMTVIVPDDLAAFQFVLTDVPTGAALFLGRVSDPSIGY